MSFLNFHFEINATFCSVPSCILHVHPGMDGVIGCGNWAKFANGLTIGRCLKNGAMMCDFCARGETEKLKNVAQQKPLI